MIGPEEIYRANAESHDACASTHDQAVPYIRRSSTRRYYWRLLCAALGGAEVFRGARVLEIGCGTGTYTDLVLEHGAASLTGIDLSPAMIARAQAKAPDPRCRWEVAPLEAFAAAHPGEFDVAFSFSFLHHLPDIRAGLAEIERLLKPGGTYAALHEIILPRERTFIEKLDDKMENVFGHGALGGESFLRRVYRALPGRLTGRRGPAPETGGGPDLVDFQLNEAFDLQKYAGGNVEVRGYPYLAFPFLLGFSAPLNHRCLILRRPDTASA